MFINSIVKTNAPLPEQDAYLRKNTGNLRA